MPPIELRVQGGARHDQQMLTLREWQEWSQRPRRSRGSGFGQVLDRQLTTPRSLLDRRRHRRIVRRSWTCEHHFFDSPRLQRLKHGGDQGFRADRPQVPRADHRERAPGGARTRAQDDRAAKARSARLDRDRVIRTKLREGSSL